MKASRIKLVSIGLLLLCSIVVNFTGCASKIKATNLMDEITPRNVSVSYNLKDGNASVTDFAVRLFKATSENKKNNTLISPLSVLAALAMTVNGARGDTLLQMEAVLGMKAQELNLYLYNYINALPQADNYKLSVANSIWFTDDESFTVNKDFLQINADFYGADIYKAPFDNRTLKDINNWVKDKTDKMIPKILEEISPETVMYLINALAFEAEWIQAYEKTQVHDNIFTKEDGTKQDVKLMYSRVGKYIYDKNATGFIKYYKGSKYAFVALLPNEGVTVSEYVNSLDGEALNALLIEAENRGVETAIPKFETEYDIEMSAILKSMGMTNAFDIACADLSGIGTFNDSNLSIDEVIHKTYIQVGEKGTKAGAVTAVGVKNDLAPDPSETKRVILDRPFVYMLIDCENNIPFFIGTMMDVNN